MEITVIGDTTVDLVSEQLPSLPKEDTEIITRFTPKLGGQAAHCALGLAEQGMDVRFITCINKEFFGDQILQALRRQNIAVRLQHGSSPAFSVIIPTPHKRTILNQAGANGELHTPSNSKISTKHLFLGGLWHLGSLDALAVFKGAKQQGIITFLDAGYQENPDYRKISGILKYTDYFFADPKELKLYMKEKTLARALQDIPCAVGIHRGKGGSSFYDKGTYITVPARQTYRGETTGAGDYWNAGFIYGIIQRWPIRKILAYANNHTIGLLKKDLHKLDLYK